MRATAYPDGIAVPLTIIGSDERDESAPGGYGRATFTALVSTNDRGRLIGAPVYIYAAAGPPWAGKVARITQQKHGVCRVECDGWQEAFGRKIRSVRYCDTNFLADLKVAGVELVPSDNPDAFTYNVAGGSVSIGIANGATVTAGNGGRYYYWGDAPLDHLDLSAYVNSVDVSLVVYSSATEGAASSAVYTQTATGAVTGQTADLSGAYGFVIRCNADGNKSAAGAGFFVRAYDLKLYGTDLASVTVSNVIGDICDQLDTDDLPAGDAYRAFMEADTTAIEPLVFNYDSNDAAKITEVMRYTDKEFGIWCRRIAGEWVPVPVLRDPGSDADYIAVIGKNCTANIGDLDIEPLASKVRVVYSDTDGRTRYVDRTDTDTSHYLVKRGIEKWGTVRVDTTSQTLAEAIGDRYLTEAGDRYTTGDITITAPIIDSDGAPVLPCEIEAGRRIKVLGLDSGAVTARITHVTKRGSYHATVTINDKPRSLAIALAQLAKREVAA